MCWEVRSTYCIYVQYLLDGELFRRRGAHNRSARRGLEIESYGRENRAETSVRTGM